MTAGLFQFDMGDQTEGFLIRVIGFRVCLHDLSLIALAFMSAVRSVFI